MENFTIKKINNHLEIFLKKPKKNIDIYSGYIRYHNSRKSLEFIELTEKEKIEFHGIENDIQQLKILMGNWIEEKMKFVPMSPFEIIDIVEVIKRIQQKS